MFWSLKSFEAAPIGTDRSQIVGTAARCLSPRHNVRDLQLLGALPLALLSVLVTAAPSSAQTGAPVTVMPGSSTVYRNVLKVGIVSATDTSGNTDMARRALMAANATISRWPGYVAVPGTTVASALSRLNLRGELVAGDYQALGKRLKAERLIAITTSPGALSDSSASYTAIGSMHPSLVMKKL